jgi:hypothetical protein
MGNYWLSYFNDYIKKRNLIDAKVYENNNEKILILPNNKDYPLSSNIFRIEDNKAYQYYSISSNKIMLNNKIYTFKQDNNIQINNDKYNKINFDITNILYIPFPHTIKIKNYKEINNKYEIELYSDTPTEYSKYIPLIYINKSDLNNILPIYENIFRYLEKNKYIGIIK